MGGGGWWRLAWSWCLLIMGGVGAGVMLALLLVLLFVVLRLSMVERALAVLLQGVGVGMRRLSLRLTGRVVSVHVLGLELQGALLSRLNSALSGRLPLEIRRASLQELTIRIDLVQVGLGDAPCTSRERTLVCTCVPGHL